MHIPPPESAFPAPDASLAPPQAAAEQVMVAGWSWGTTLKAIVGDASQWVGDHPGVVLALATVLFLAAWSLRPGPR